ncbi:polysaccharide deacetylase family protein [Sphingomonas sp.]|uniref:polysaccharide deacetylase family protein n=1 Tax=Sphingomonas sp. TaxID=28214 RepID=UPI001B12C2C9|nr:polysaccharide deacetylase family protein [Sphingomonas sp.]MBO9712018.1 polysaccharide deacetylase family protein [Sphingomonas sp.]
MTGAARGYRVPAPEPEAAVAWPQAFGTRFLVFVDTEEEFDWRLPFSRDRHGVTHVTALPTVQARFAKRGVPLTWLADYPIVASDEGAAVLRELVADGVSEVGTQLHPWVNPPFDEELSGPNSFVGNLPAALEEAKLARLTEAIEAAVGRRPRIYRAGRYGIGPHTAGILARLGYRADCSVRACYDYTSEAGPDFAAVGNPAYRFGPENSLIELPFSTVFTGMLRGQGEPLYRTLGKLPRGRGVAARLGLLSRVSLTPEDMPLADAEEAVRVALGEGERLLSFAFHSPSVVPGHTPYVRTERDLVDFHRWWDRILALLDRLGAKPASLGEVLAAAEDA